MFGKKNEKLEILKDLIGNRAGYTETVKMLKLEGKEKDLFMRASLEVKKSEPNLAIIEQAHAILVRKSFQGETEEGAESKIYDNDNTPPPPEKKKPKVSSDNHGLKDGASPSSRHTNYTPEADENTNNINYKSLNYKPQRKSYVKYLAVAVVVVGVYFFINNTPAPEEDTIESKIQKHGYSKISNSSKKTVDEVLADADKKFEDTNKEYLAMKQKMKPKIRTYKGFDIENNFNKIKVYMKKGQRDSYYDNQPMFYKFHQACNYYELQKNYKGKYRQQGEETFQFASANMNLESMEVSKKTGHVKYKLSCLFGTKQGAIRTGFRDISGTYGKNEMLDVIEKTCIFMPSNTCPKKPSIEVKRFFEKQGDFFRKFTRKN